MHLAQELVMDVVHPLIVIGNSAVVVQEVLQRRQEFEDEEHGSGLSEVDNSWEPSSKLIL